MEIHHPHHGHHPRKIKDYLFEFLMLFLAISGGFFMENTRESYIDHKIEKEYISSMINDLKEDTTSIIEVLHTLKNQTEGIDSLLEFIEKSGKVFEAKPFYHFAFTYASSFIGYSSQDITITQLKNSGGFRLIGKKAVADSIVKYYSLYDSHKEQEMYNIRIMEDLIKFTSSFLDFKVLRTNHFPEFIDDQEKMKEFYNRVIMINYTVKNDFIWLSKFRSKSVSLLKFLEKEYSIKHSKSGE